MPQSNPPGMSTHTRGGHMNRRARPSFFTPLHPPNPPTPAQIEAQARFLETLAEEELPKIEMTDEEFQSKDTFKRQLWSLYNPSPDFRTDIWSQCMILMALATGSLGTEHYGWGDVLFERVKASCATLDDVVNLQTVQISLLMISASTT